MHAKNWILWTHMGRGGITVAYEVCWARDGENRRESGTSSLPSFSALLFLLYYWVLPLRHHFLFLCHFVLLFGQMWPWLYLTGFFQLQDLMPTAQPLNIQCSPSWEGFAWPSHLLSSGQSTGSLQTTDWFPGVLCCSLSDELWLQVARACGIKYNFLNINDGCF